MLGQPRAVLAQGSLLPRGRDGRGLRVAADAARLTDRVMQVVGDGAVR